MAAVVVNAFLFDQTSFDSAGLTPLATIHHPLLTDGVYDGTVIRDGTEVGGISITVNPTSSIMQLELDLGTIGKHSYMGGSRRVPEYVVGYGAYLTLCVKQDSGCYSFKLWNRATGAIEQDSGTLQSGDLFAVVLLRPGSYTVREELSGTEVELEVTQILAGDTSAIPEPLQIDIATIGSEANMVSSPGQSIVFQASSSARITIEMDPC